MARSRTGAPVLAMRAVLSASLFALLAPAPARALSVGEPQLLSRLAQPLHVRVPVTFGEGEVSGVPQARLLMGNAADSDISDMPLIAPDSVRVVIEGSGRVYWIDIAGREPLREPMSRLMLEVSMAGTRVQHEWPLMLDPPDGAAAPARVPESAHAAESARPDAVRRTQSVPPRPRERSTAAAPVRRSGLSESFSSFRDWVASGGDPLPRPRVSAPAPIEHPAAPGVALPPPAAATHAPHPAARPQAASLAPAGLIQAPPRTPFAAIVVIALIVSLAFLGVLRRLATRAPPDRAGVSPRPLPPRVPALRSAPQPHDADRAVMDAGVELVIPAGAPLPAFAGGAHADLADAFPEFRGPSHAVDSPTDPYIPALDAAALRRRAAELAARVTDPDLHRRLQLVEAYLDLGRHEAAQRLLMEIEAAMSPGRPRMSLVKG